MSATAARPRRSSSSSAKPKLPKPKKKPGRFSREKGARFERELVIELSEAGLDAARVPLSGMGHEARANDEFAGDVVAMWPPTAKREKFEAKKRAAGFATLYKWLGRHRGLFIAADRKETLVVLRLRDFVELVRDKGRLESLEG